MRKVYAKILAARRRKAGTSQPAVLRGALPAGGIPVPSGVDLSSPSGRLLAAGTRPTALGQGVWKGEGEAQGQTRGALSFTFFME